MLHNIGIHQFLEKKGKVDFQFDGFCVLLSPKTFLLINLAFARGESTGLSVPSPRPAYPKGFGVRRFCGLSTAIPARKVKCQQNHFAFN
jgi:hypothetical protein